MPLALVDPDTDSADYEEEFALVDVADYSEQDDLIDDLIAGLEVPEDAVVEDITVTENILETIVTSTPSNLPQVGTTERIIPMRKRLTIEGLPIMKHKQQQRLIIIGSVMIAVVSMMMMVIIVFCLV